MKNWYLMSDSSRPNSLGGYEDEALINEKTDAFLESLNTSLGNTVMLYNSDLSEIGEVRIIVQDNLAKTQLKSLERYVLAPIGTLKAGMYIKYEDVYWLVTGYPGNNTVYEKATIILCQFKLKWQTADGRIIERWANYTSASKYDVGENGNYTIYVSSNNFTVWIPDDEDGLTLDGKRVFIDHDTKNPKMVYKVTRSDEVLYLFGEKHGGILSYIVSKTELNMNIDRPDLGLCDYIFPKEKHTEENNTDVNIVGGNFLRLNRNKTWTVNGVDSDNTEIEWNVVSDYNIKTTIVDNKIQLLIEDEDAISSSFLLQVTIYSVVVCEKRIDVIQGF